MRVALNDRVLLKTPTGVGHYVRELVRAMDAVEGVELRPILTGLPGLRQAEPADGGTPSGIGRRSKRLHGAARRAAGFGLDTVFRVASRGFDLYHEPNHVPSASRLPTITTVHDLSVLVNPAWHPPDRVRWYERGFERGLARSRRLLTVSAFTRDELERVLGVSADRVTVTPLGPRAGMEPVPSERADAALRKAGLERGYFLFVGTLEPRKNLETLLDAHGRLPESVRRRHPLVLAGGVGWNAGELVERIEREQASGCVRALGYVSDELLPALYAGARAAVLASWYEGFGLPAVEAMACGTPMMVSTAGSLVEVVGEAGPAIDPGDVEAWTEGLARAADDDAWRARCIEAGLERARLFSWERCAAATAAGYSAALGA